MVINFLMLSTLLHQEDGTVILLQDKSGDLSRKKIGCGKTKPTTSFHTVVPQNETTDNQADRDAENTPINILSHSVLAIFAKYKLSGIRSGMILNFTKQIVRHKQQRNKKVSLILSIGGNIMCSGVVNYYASNHSWLIRIAS